MTDPIYLLIGEAPAKDETKTNLHVTLACEALGLWRSFQDVVDLPKIQAESPAMIEFVRRTDHVNLLRTWPGPGRRGSEFPLPVAKKAARALLKSPMPAALELILLCGRRVSYAFGFNQKLSYFETTSVEWVRTGKHPIKIPTVVVPHPSRINGWWNHDRNRKALRRFLESLATA